jgi:hypothetical protein
MRGVEKLASVRRLYRTVVIKVCLFFYEAVVFSATYPVCKAQLIGDWYENRQGDRNTIILLIMRQYYWRTDAPCANSNGGPNTKKNYWRTVPGQHCLLADGDIGAPLTIGAPIHLASIVLAH